MTTHTITLARHTAQVVGLMGVLVLGTWDSYGTDQLLLRHGPEWEGLAIDATFHNVPSDEGVTVLADTDGLVTVPPEACMRASKYATITIRGVQDGVQRISCNLPYMVLDHAQVPGANSTATPSENAQALTPDAGLAGRRCRRQEPGRSCARRCCQQCRCSQGIRNQRRPVRHCCQNGTECSRDGKSRCGNGTKGRCIQRQQCKYIRKHCDDTGSGGKIQRHNSKGIGGGGGKICQRGSRQRGYEGSYADRSDSGYPAGDPAGIELAASAAARAQDESTTAADDLLAMDTGADETADILLDESEGLT